MKLKNIAKQIISEAAGMPGVTLDGVPVDNGTLLWKVTIGKGAWGEEGFPFFNGLNAIHQHKEQNADHYIPAGGSVSLVAWKILEHFKVLAEVSGDPIPKDFYEAMDYMNEWKDYKSITPDPAEKIASALLRDSNDVIYLVNYPEIGKKTQWTDVNWSSRPSGFEKMVWNKSIYIGDNNKSWFAKKYNKSIATVNKESLNITAMDRVTAKLIVAGSEGTDEVLLTAALKEIKTMSDYKHVNEQLEKLAELQPRTSMWTNELFILRNGDVKFSTRANLHANMEMYKVPSTGAANVLTTSSNTGYGPYSIKYAILHDYWLTFSTLSSIKSIPRYIEGEMNEGDYRDTALRVLVTNGICKYNQGANLAIFPDSNYTWSIESPTMAFKNDQITLGQNEKFRYVVGKKAEKSE